MNRSFDHIIKSTINCSPSKQTHTFPHSPRFRKEPSPACYRHSYDLTGLNMTAQLQKKMDTSSKSPRFRQNKAQLSPGPDSYRHRSFVEQAQYLRKGPRIDLSQRRPKDSQQKSPGPASYNPKLSHSSPFITISPRYSNPKTQEYLGPGAYELDKYGTIAAKRANIYSKYASTSFYRIGNQKRFPQKIKEGAPGPGAYNSNSNLKFTKTLYSFGNERRNTFPTKKDIPGPGAYQQFSEFAERRRNMQSKLQRMTYLLDGHR